jgi:very-short-patch-repair endonuclease/muconolactone delta-isomerase
MVRWPSQQTRRAPDFGWVGSAREARESLLIGFDDLRVPRDHPLFDTARGISTAISLNPYEREALYGYPYLVGRLSGKPVRAPIFTVPIELAAEGSGYRVFLKDEVVEFNPMPYLSDVTSDARDLAVITLAASTPSLPLTPEGLRRFADALRREIKEVRVSARLDGSLDEPSTRPSEGGNDYLDIVDQAAIFIAPRASYFLASDLDAIGQGKAAIAESAIIPLLAGAGDVAQVDITDEMERNHKVYFPFPSNRAQRRVALLLDDPTTSVVRVDGPPGTGKSLTIANLVCHVVAQGKSVLVTSQKDKALDVVNAKLNELGSPLLPMTLLRRNKGPLLERLQLISKQRSLQEVEHTLAIYEKQYDQARHQYQALAPDHQRALDVEARIAQADRDYARVQGRFDRWWKSFGWKRKVDAFARQAPASSQVSEQASSIRARVQDLAEQTLLLRAEHRIASETRAQKQNRQELSKVVKRNAGSYKNFSLFDSLKQDLDRASLLLRSLPAWVMGPDDVARLFPCREGVFDVVIVDEASQVDLPSILPIVYRGRKVVICGDTRQMQPQRFAFTASTVATSVWYKHGMPGYFNNQAFYPTKQSLLELVQSRAEEEVFLDEHFRCLPSIITYSNERWYGNRMRIMTDETRKSYGSPTTPAMVLHPMGGRVDPSGGQVNLVEARALVDLLKELVTNPEYEGATIGVLCLFEEQVRHIQQLVADEVSEDDRKEHEIVVLNPDGMQGDERDVILYSLSFDNDGMTRQQLTPRIHNQAHIQGMLNVAFTRPRHEVHIFHSAAVSDFGFADGTESSLSRWLAHAARVQAAGRLYRTEARTGRVDSIFESQVADELLRRGYQVENQYPACGFWIDIVVSHSSLPGIRLAVECDGEHWHQDELGNAKLSDLEREEVLERAGWTILRIPYRSWRMSPSAEIERVEAYFRRRLNPEQQPAEGSGFIPAEPVTVAPSRQQMVNDLTQQAIVRACQAGHTDPREVARAALPALGRMRRSEGLLEEFEAAAQDLVHRGLLAIEHDGWFLTPDGRGCILGDATRRRWTVPPRQALRPRSYYRPRPAQRSGGCSCGGRWVLRNGPYGQFYGCSNYPRCKRTRAA